MKTREYMSKIGLEGALMALSPALFLIPFLGHDNSFPSGSRLVLTCLGILACWGSALTLFRYPKTGKTMAVVVIASNYSIILPQLLENPFIALSSSIVFIFSIFMVVDFEIVTTTQRRNHVERRLQRAKWAILVVPLVVGMTFVIPTPTSTIRGIVLAGYSIITQCLIIHYLFTIRAVKSCFLIFFVFAIFLVSLRNYEIAFSFEIVASISVLNWFILPRSRVSKERGEQWWEFWLDHPARILIITFFFLCAFGAILLLFPISTVENNIGIIDAVFTSVSAVCVTGLIVLDTPNAFSGFGQTCILLLIQLGGLGIMTITTVALQTIGRRLSLKQERLLTSLTDTSHRDLVNALKNILKLTFACESIGAALLTGSFYLSGDSIFTAMWRGTFTSISAFCNAGFALQSDNLVPYQSNSTVLFTVSFLIIIGGMAPATSLLVPKWVLGKQVPIPAKISLVTTITLLLAGTFCILAFEWTGILSGLSISEKIQNAWFQSATLRTAGFNSVDITHISNVTFLLMIIFMFIGGSPGGTAGGVKTTTVAILGMTFWTSIANRNEIITQKRRIHPNTVYRAVTIVIAGFALWFLVVIMLEITQQISLRDLLFEATSAIGTVGLSTGATLKLDEIGKVIIILAMFAGRIGPVTLFMLLSDVQAISDTRYPVENITIT